MNAKHPLPAPVAAALEGAPTAQHFIIASYMDSLMDKLVELTVANHIATQRLQTLTGFVESELADLKRQAEDPNAALDAATQARELFAKITKGGAA